MSSRTVSDTERFAEEMDTTVPFAMDDEEEDYDYQLDVGQDEADEDHLSPTPAFPAMGDYSRHSPNSFLRLLNPHHHASNPLHSLMLHRMFRSPEPTTNTFSSPKSLFDSSRRSHSIPHTCLVYLIRHGEASHNVLEKRAQKIAKERAEAEGLSPEQVHERMEESRMAVLTDESLRDACLSEMGRNDALNARTTLEGLLKEHGWTMPAKVLVSPLTRTLQTADIIFQHHKSICVHEEIQERQTGQPCDSRQSSTKLSKDFRRFRMHAMESFQDDSMFLSDGDESDEGSSSSISSQDEFPHEASRLSKSLGHNNLCLNQVRSTVHRTLSEPLQRIEENKAELRERTRKLLALLDEPSIAVVTHKGYLRELERGTLGQPNAKEFTNGEIRVYRIHLGANQELEKAVRVA